MLRLCNKMPTKCPIEIFSVSLVIISFKFSPKVVEMTEANDLANYEMNILRVRLIREKRLNNNYSLKNELLSCFRI